MDGEQPGLMAETPPSDGLGMMTSFGEGFSMTPLELTAIMSGGGQRRNALLSAASGHQAGHDGRGGIWHRAPRHRVQRHRTDFRQDRNLHRQPVAHALGWFGSYNEIAGASWWWWFC
jgi:hypothetical protein